MSDDGEIEIEFELAPVFPVEPDFWVDRIYFAEDHETKIYTECQPSGQGHVRCSASSIFDILDGELPLLENGEVADASDFVRIFLKEKASELASKYEVVAVQSPYYDSGADVAVFMVSYSRWLELNAGLERLPVHRKVVDGDGSVSYPFVSLPEFGDGDHHAAATTFYPCRRLLSVCSIAEPGSQA
jgi:hypothetical protein